MADFAEQRRNMVESQVRPSEATDRRVIAAMGEVPRELFVSEAQRAIAYMDSDLPLVRARPGRPGRSLMAPQTLARLITLLAVERGEVVLDVGSGCGYAAAVLGKLAETVIALECDGDLAAGASKTLTDLSHDNVAVVEGPLEKGWPQAAPYAAILVEGTVPDAPEALLGQLADGGRLVAIVGDATLGQATLWTRRGAHLDRRVAFDAGAAALPGFERPRAFQL